MITRRINLCPVVEFPDSRGVLAVTKCNIQNSLIMENYDEEAKQMRRYTALMLLP
jgi:hypothetical protein